MGENYDFPPLADRDSLEAWTTCLEQPAGGFGTLLATQRWKRKESGGADAQWTLVAHRTIPFSLNAGEPLNRTRSESEGYGESEQGVMWRVR